MSNGLKREIDVALGDVYVQVKGGNARGLIGQMTKTAATTGKQVFAYAPGMSDTAVRDGLRNGFQIARTVPELIDMLRYWT